MIEAVLKAFYYNEDDLNSKKEYIKILSEILKGNMCKNEVSVEFADQIINVGKHLLTKFDEAIHQDNLF